MALVKSKTVSFNVESDEKELLEWATTQKIPFSQYIKELVRWDMKRRKVPPTQGINIKIP